jgi:hypothetical protein
MPATTIRGTQVLDGSIQRADIDVSTVGQAVTRKIIQGTGITLSSTGADSGTGDVTVSGAAHAATHESGGSDAIPLDLLAAATDIVSLNVSTAAHGLMPKLAGGTSNFFRADGSWAAPAGAGDMTRAVYDTNADNIVDHAALSDAAPWTGISGKPATFPATPGGTNGQVQFNTGAALGGFTVGGYGALNTGTGALTVNRVKGVIDGSEPAAGDVGEVISSTVLSASRVAVVSGTPFNVTTITLTPGDWDVSGNMAVTGSAVLFTGLNACANTANTFPDGALFSTFVSTGGVALLGGPIPPLRVNVTVNTTVYLHGQTACSGGTSPGACGYILARRFR